MQEIKALEEATDTTEDGNKNIQANRILAPNLTALCSDITQLKTSVEFANSEVQFVKTSLAAKADQTLVNKLVERIDDLENRCKQNNIVIWNVPKGCREAVLFL